ncbi:hypothetical protein JZ751_027570 [Albula glossodonta]|uniref:Protein kinase domain-containing protein n=1 Tax=Albula glossodonta TaxID=121402 RepID=A0A8T2MWI6_9TELE|nr:hypothetical protein JZ751_027570 [Albula glossodonta]
MICWQICWVADVGVVMGVAYLRCECGVLQVRLPVKWMAPESLFQGVYTMQSDVWSYGILLWEIFSLGVTPYPGIKVDQHFYVLIENGFQMDQPYYASESVYQVMHLCWALQPSARPPFSKLVAFMEAELEHLEEKLYFNITGSTVYKNVPLTNGAAEGCGGGVVHCFSELGGAVWWQHALDSELRGRGSVEGKQCRAVAEPCRAPAPQSFTSPASR